MVTDVYPQVAHVTASAKCGLKCQVFFYDFFSPRSSNTLIWKRLLNPKGLSSRPAGDAYFCAPHKTRFEKKAAALPLPFPQGFR
jgi:hypothetical protein